jgi:CTP:molybdopterin cytidylyltransferase MocA
VLASDLPRVAAALGPLLQGASRAVAEGVDGAWVVDDTGRGQPLVSCLSSARLRSVMPAEPQGYPLHQVLAQLRLTAVNVPRGSVSDVDTAADLTRLRQDLAQPTQEDHDE